MYINLIFLLTLLTIIFATTFALAKFIDKLDEERETREREKWSRTLEEKKKE